MITSDFKVKYLTELLKEEVSQMSDEQKLNLAIDLNLQVKEIPEKEDLIRTETSAWLQQQFMRKN